MTTHSNKNYFVTKQLIKGEGKLSPPFEEIKGWIKNNYNIKPISIIFDRWKYNERPELYIFLDLFYKIENEDEIKSEIATEFIKIAKNYSKKKGRTLFLERRTDESKIENIHIIFQYFRIMVLSEANSNIPKEDILNLKKYLKLFNIYEILSCFEHTTFFFDTDKHYIESIENESRESILKEYFKLIKQHDEFDCLKYKYFLDKVRFESKESFDKRNNSIYDFYR